MKLDQELFNLVLDRLNLGLQVGTFVGSNGGSNDGTRDTASTTQSSLGWDKNVRNVLIFTKQRKMQQDFKRFGISYLIYYRKFLISYHNYFFHIMFLSPNPMGCSAATITKNIYIYIKHFSKTNRFPCPYLLFVTGVKANFSSFAFFLYIFFSFCYCWSSQFLNLPAMTMNSEIPRLRVLVAIKVKKIYFLRISFHWQNKISI